MKKLLSLAMCLCLAVTLIAGCAKTTPSTSTQDIQAASDEVQASQEVVPTESASLAEEPPIAEPEAAKVEYPISDGSDTLTLWTSGFLTDIDAYFNNQLYYTTMEERTGVKLEFTVASMQQSSEQFSLMAAGGEFTDLISSISSYYSGGLARAVEDMVIVDLSQYLDTCMPAYKSVLESDPAYVKAVSSDDGCIGQAANLIAPDNPVTSGPVIRKDWLGKLGLDIPETYEEYRNVLSAFKTELGADAPLWIPYMGCVAGNYLSAGFGVASYSLYNRNEEPYYQVDGVVHYGPVEDGYFDYLSTLSQWYTEGLVWQDFSTSNNPRMPETELILNDRTGLAYFSADNFASFESAYSNGTMELIGIKDAVQNKGDTNHLRAGDSIIDGAQGVAISTSCSDPELAAKWLDYNYTADGQILTNYGVENVTFQYVDGQPQYTALIANNSEGLTVQEAQNLYLFGKGNCFENGSRSLQFYPDNAVEATKVWSEYDNDYLYPVGLNMSIDESEQYSKLYADIATYVTESTLKFIMGQEPVTKESFDAFTATIYKLGLDDCLAIKQALLDRYNSR